jgi:hypothetical protein
VGADYNGWADVPEDEREDLEVFEAGELGKRDEWEDWGEDEAGPLYWLYKRADETGEV